MEITGPVDRKMVINALNSGANVFMADFEDSNAPTWDNLIEGQLNLRDAIDRTIEYVSPEGKHYALNERVAVLLARPRGWHLPERHVRVDGEVLSASLFDFGLYVFHNTSRLLARGTAPYFYLPKLENHLEARLWNEVFVAAQEALGVPVGTFRATVLIETILAAFEQDEILLRAAGPHRRAQLRPLGLHLQLHQEIPGARPASCCPTGARSAWTASFLRSYTRWWCGPATAGAPTPWAAWRRRSRSRTTRTPTARRWKRSGRTSSGKSADGHDGTWVAHPGLVGAGAGDLRCRACRGANQIARAVPALEIGPDDLLAVPEGPITEQGLRHNITVGLLYLESWLQRHRMRPHLQPDGRCGHRGDLPEPGLAVDPARGPAGRRPGGDPRALPGGDGGGTGTDPDAGGRRPLPGGPASTWPNGCSTGSSPARNSRTS